MVSDTPPECIRWVPTPAALCGDDGALRHVNAAWTTALPAPEGPIWSALGASKLEAWWLSGEDTTEVEVGGQFWSVQRGDGPTPDVRVVSLSPTESKLQSSLLQLLEWSPTLPALADVRGHFTWLGSRWEQLLGYTRAELMAQPFIEFVHPEDRLRTASEAAKLVHGDVTLHFENRYRTRDGRYVWLSWFSNFDPESQQIYAIAHDATQMVELREELQQKRVMLEQTANMARMGGWEVDLRTMTPTWSDETKRIHEVPLSEQPSLEEAIEFYALEARPIVEAAVQDAIETGKGWDFELPLITRTGREIWVRAMGACEYIDGAPARLYGMFQDVSPIRAAERLKHDLISTVSHELRTPLTAIYGALRLIEREAEGLEAIGKRFLEVARSNVDRLRQIVDDLLDVERLSEGRLQLDVGAFDAAGLLHEIADSVAPLASNSRVEVAVESERNVEVHADRLRLIQVLINLVTNAVHVSEAGAQVTLRALAHPDGVRFEVEDHGPGLSPEHQRAVFERFRQLPGVAVRRPGGSGLGLTIARQLVDLHGGAIGVDSQLGQGATFWVELPGRDA